MRRGKAAGSLNNERACATREDETQRLGSRHWGLGNGKRSGELVQWNGAKGCGSGGEKGFNPAYGFGRQQNVPANVAHLGGNVIDHDDLAPVFHGMDDRSRFVRAWASCNRAFQAWLLLSRGVRHFGGRGSHAVIKISIGCAVVQMMCSARPCRYWRTLGPSPLSLRAQPLVPRCFSLNPLNTYGVRPLRWGSVGATCQPPVRPMSAGQCTYGPVSGP